MFCSELENKILVQHSGKEKVSRRALINENEKMSLRDIFLFVQQKLVSLRGVELGSSPDEAD